MTSDERDGRHLAADRDEPSGPARGDRPHARHDQEGQDQRREERQAQREDAGRNIGEAAQGRMGHGQRHVEREEDDRRRDEKHQQRRAEREVALAALASLIKNGAPADPASRKSPSASGGSIGMTRSIPTASSGTRTKFATKARNTARASRSGPRICPDAVGESDRQHAAHGEDR